MASSVAAGASLPVLTLILAYFNVLSQQAVAPRGLEGAKGFDSSAVGGGESVRSSQVTEQRTEPRKLSRCSMPSGVERGILHWDKTWWQ